MVPLNDGHNARVVEWQANNLHHFPVRIDCVQGTNTITLNFTDIRLPISRAGIVFVRRMDLPRIQMGCA